ncbi:hypothetical protein PHLH4_30680 [Pseudomonas sp. St316]|nr:hypothetical protein PHLH4_30680 [Pseudomonas sp. St316]
MCAPRSANFPPSPTALKLHRQISMLMNGDTDYTERKQQAGLIALIHWAPNPHFGAPA